MLINRLKIKMSNTDNIVLLLYLIKSRFTQISKIHNNNELVLLNSNVLCCTLVLM